MVKGCALLGDRVVGHGFCPRGSEKRTRFNPASSLPHDAVPYCTRRLGRAVITAVMSIILWRTDAQNGRFMTGRNIVTSHQELQRVTHSISLSDQKWTPRPGGNGNLRRNHDLVVYFFLAKDIPCLINTCPPRGPD
jgi:hypothetical protein